jgi:hypothetical protein
MVAKPFPTATTFPVEDTVATFVLEENHDTSFSLAVK